MKHSPLKLILLALALILLLCACAPQTDTVPNDEQPQANEYLSTIAALEAKLNEERTSFAKSEALYLQTIAALEERLELLSNAQPPLQEGEDSVKFRYRVENGSAVITGYEGNAALLSVPATLDGYPVISIGERAFEGADITAIVVPDGVQDIGWFAFYNCYALVNVTLPQSISSIGYAVFDGCAAPTIYCTAGSYAERYARSYGIFCITN